MEEKKITNINIENILPNRMQPRIMFQDETIDELAESIKKHGIINPITVRRLGEKYEIIAGERRYKASQTLGLKEIPAIIIDADDKKTAELALIENVQRKELSPIEEGMSYEKILQIGELTQAELSKQLGKKQSTIANKIRLLKLDDSVKEALLNEKISERHARSLLKLYDKKDQENMLNRIINERLTVRQTDKEIEKIIEEKGELIDMNRKFDLPESNVIFDKENEEIKEPGFQVNPSFVDVKKSEETSEDLFKEKPIINIEDLLKVVPSNESKYEEPKEEKTEEPVKEESYPEMPKPKFFNMFMPEEDEQPKEENKSLETKEVNEPLMSFNINDIESFEPSYEETENDEEKITGENELPEVKVENIPETMEDTFENNIENDFNDEPEFDFNNFNPIIHNDFAGEEINEEDVEFFEEEEEEPEPPREDSPKQLKDVIRIIRDCNDIIESYGYRIETEEFDLDTMYQAIFKIYKN